MQIQIPSYGFETEISDCKRLSDTIFRLRSVPLQHILEERMHFPVRLILLFADSKPELGIQIEDAFADSDLGEDFRFLPVTFTYPIL